MTLLEAFQIINRPQTEQDKQFRIQLVCGFTPLHLVTFLRAHGQLRAPCRRVVVSHGLYGDLVGNLHRDEDPASDACALVVEWSDLDPRLGLRSAGGWEPTRLWEIRQSVQVQLARIHDAVLAKAPQPAVVVLPTLPLLPVPYTRPGQLSVFEAGLRADLASFAASLTECAHVRLLSGAEIDLRSAPSTRLDVASELAVGFPYTLSHAEHLAVLLVEFLLAHTRKKGIITDLDDTLWKGILGDVGPDQVGWTLDCKAQIHGLYQQMLASLAASGILLAVASKNNADLVEVAFARYDMLLPRRCVFPIEANWGPKSDSVARVLKVWNIGADDVLFIDDSPMEIAEVQSAYPAIQSIRFPKDDSHAAWELLKHLRDQFGAQQIDAEDAIRLESLRTRAQIESQSVSGSGGNGVEAFLAALQAEITFSLCSAGDSRSFTLLNKTNQFNLNGQRLSEAEWIHLLTSNGHFAVKVQYRDRFGFQGTIAILGGQIVHDQIFVDHWVMSCRAFSRRIEHHCLNWVFQHFKGKEITLRFSPTPRNGPLQEFLTAFLGPLPFSSLTITRDVFQNSCPALYHRVVETIA